MALLLLWRYHLRLASFSHVDLRKLSCSSISIIELLNLLPVCNKLTAVVQSFDTLILNIILLLINWRLRLFIIPFLLLLINFERSSGLKSLLLFRPLIVQNSSFLTHDSILLVIYLLWRWLGYLSASPVLLHHHASGGSHHQLLTVWMSLNGLLRNYFRREILCPAVDGTRLRHNQLVFVRNKIALASTYFYWRRAPCHLTPALSILEEYFVLLDDIEGTRTLERLWLFHLIIDEDLLMLDLRNFLEQGKLIIRQLFIWVDSRDCIYG